MITPLYFEQKVAERLGISRRDLKYIRDEILKKNEGWCFSGRDVALTVRGCAAVLTHLRASSGTTLLNDIDFTDCRIPGTDAPGKKNGAENGDEQLTVHRTYPNPRLLEARTDGGELVTVLVKNNKNFRPKMKIRAQIVRPGRYELEGRCPRFPGRY